MNNTFRKKITAGEKDKNLNKKERRLLEEFERK